jgi:hypothetical protein
MDMHTVFEEIKRVRSKVNEKLTSGDAQPCKTLVLATLDELTAKLQEKENQYLEEMTKHYNQD